jgi:MFS superfamily sulfate permease-like transporter
MLLGTDDPPTRTPSAGAAERRVRADDLVVYRIDGPIFFGAADRFFEELLRVDHGIRAVVLRMRGVPVMDVTGATALRTLVDRLARRDILVLISRLQEQPREILERTGILERDHPPRRPPVRQHRRRHRPCPTPPGLRRPHRPGPRRYEQAVPALFPPSGTSREHRSGALEP